MKTLIFNGSPRKNGDTMALIQQMQQHLVGSVEILHAYGEENHPCIDCRHCWEKPGCIYTDPLQQALTQIHTYDNIIIASPIYFSELTGALLHLCSRFQQLYAARRFRGVRNQTAKKNGVLILTGGGNGSFEPAEKTAKILFGELHATYLGLVLSHDTDHIPAKEDAKAINQATEMAKMLNGCFYEKTTKNVQEDAR